ncbi:MAG: class I SAM-dependent methyltransferase [Planctomycetota bacterium]|jgi:predicted methyltransferase
MAAWFLLLVLLTGPPADDWRSPDTLTAAVYAVVSGPAGADRDWDRYRALFREGAPFTTFDDAGRVITFGVDEYIASYGPSFVDRGILEREIWSRTERHGRLASRWSTGEYRWGRPSGAAVGRTSVTLQFVDGDGRWWITAMTWQAADADHPIPPERLPPPVVYTGRRPFEPMPPDLPPAIVSRSKTERERPIHLDLPLRAAGIKPGQTVADIGCGKGRHALEFAAATGPGGLVYCRDPSRPSIEVLRESIAEAGATNLDVAVSEKSDVGIPEQRVDLALLVDVYRYVMRQEETKDDFLDSLFAAMSPGGVVVVMHIKSSHLKDAELRARLHGVMIDDFARHGFVPGRRVEILDEAWPREILEFQRPAPD